MTTRSASAEDGARPRLLTRQEAAEYLRVSLRTLERHGPEGISIGARVLYTQELLDAWLASRTPSITCAVKPDEQSLITTPRPRQVDARRSRSVSRTIL